MNDMESAESICNKLESDIKSWGNYTTPFWISAKEIIRQAISKAHERGRKEGLEEAIEIANHVPLEEQFIPAGNYSSKGMSGLVKVVRKGIVEEIRNAKR